VEDAVRAGASELLVEPEPAGVAVRFRVDGVLQEVLFVPKHFQVPLLRRLKTVLSLDPRETRRIQARRVTVTACGRPVEARITVRPGLNGECVLLEFLDASGPLKLDELGLSDHGLAALQEALAETDGLVVIAGPKASGRPSTAQPILDDHRRRSEKDPAGPALGFLGALAPPA